MGGRYVAVVVVVELWVEQWEGRMDNGIYFLVASDADKRKGVRTSAASDVY